MHVDDIIQVNGREPQRARRWVPRKPPGIWARADHPVVATATIAPLSQLDEPPAHTPRCWLGNDPEGMFPTLVVRILSHKAGRSGAERVEALAIGGGSRSLFIQTFDRLLVQSNCSRIDGCECLCQFASCCLESMPWHRAPSCLGRWLAQSEDGEDVGTSLKPTD